MLGGLPEAVRDRDSTSGKARRLVEPVLLPNRGRLPVESLGLVSVRLPEVRNVRRQRPAELPYPEAVAKKQSRELLRHVVRRTKLGWMRSTAMHNLRADPGAPAD